MGHSLTAPVAHETVLGAFGLATQPSVATTTASETAGDPISVGSYPWGIAYDSGKKEVFVANDGSLNVSVISDATDTVAATVVVGQIPLGVTYDSGKSEVFVANDDSDDLSVISG